MNPILFQSTAAIAGMPAGSAALVAGDGGGYESSFAVMLAGIMGGGATASASTVFQSAADGTAVPVRMDCGGFRQVRALFETCEDSSSIAAGQLAVVHTIPAELVASTGEGGEESIPVLLCISETDTGDDMIAASVLSTGEQAAGVEQLLASGVPVTVRLRETSAGIDDVPVSSLPMPGVVTPLRELPGDAAPVTDAGLPPTVPVTADIPAATDDELQLGRSMPAQSPVPADAASRAGAAAPAIPAEPAPAIPEADSPVRIPVRLAVTGETDTQKTPHSAAHISEAPAHTAMTATPVTDTSEPAMAPAPLSTVPAADRQATGVIGSTPETSDTNADNVVVSTVRDGVKPGSSNQSVTASSADTTNDVLALLAKNGAVSVVLDRQSPVVVRQPETRADMPGPGISETVATQDMQTMNISSAGDERHPRPVDLPGLPSTAMTGHVAPETATTGIPADVPSPSAEGEMAAGTMPSSTPDTTIPVRIEWTYRNVPGPGAVPADRNTGIVAGDDARLPSDSVSRTVTRPAATIPATLADTASEPVADTQTTGSETAPATDTGVPETSARPMVSTARHLGGNAVIPPVERARPASADMASPSRKTAMADNAKPAPSAIGAQSGQDMAIADTPSSPPAASATERTVSGVPGTLPGRDIYRTDADMPHQTEPIPPQDAANRFGGTAGMPSDGSRVSPPSGDSPGMVNSAVTGADDTSAGTPAGRSAQPSTPASLPAEDSMTSDGITRTDSASTGRGHDVAPVQSSGVPRRAEMSVMSGNTIETTATADAANGTPPSNEQPAPEPTQISVTTETSTDRIAAHAAASPAVPVEGHVVPRVERSTYRSETLRERPASHSRTAVVSGERSERPENRPVITAGADSSAARSTLEELPQYDRAGDGRLDVEGTFVVPGDGSEPVMTGGGQGAVVTMEAPEAHQTSSANPAGHASADRMPAADPRLVANTIVRHARIMLRQNESSARIQLEPPHLGKLQLDIVTEHSKVTGKITVESAEVRDMIQNNLSQLRESLAQNGLKVQSFDVQVGHNGGTDSWARMETARQQTRDRMNTRQGYGSGESQPPVESVETGPIRHGSPGYSTYFDRWI